MTKFLLIVFTSLASITLIDFTPETSLEGWFIENDTVMGGRSSSSFVIQDNGHAIFKGHVSKKYNGGFAGVKFEKRDFLIGGTTKAIIRVKGDGKNYKLRLKKDIGHLYSYQATFSTTGQWQTIEIPFSELEGTYRGRKIKTSAFESGKIDQLGLLIANGVEEDFTLEVDFIRFE